MANTEFRGEGRWVLAGQLGKGGQGAVYRAVSTDFEISRADGVRDARRALSKLTSVVAPDDAESDELMRAMLEAARKWASKPTHSQVGAFKQYEIRGGEEGDQARRRFEAELRALRKMANYPGILRLLDSGSDWIVTELHARGTLEQNRKLYFGRALDALRALRPIVEAVAYIHEIGMVHRDIKSANVFLADDQSLVLGDFGIVFFEDAEHTRVTESLERVGTRDWMPPWTHTGFRVEQVPPNFDVFALGKLVWCLISGRPFLPHWFWTEPENNLAEMFPNRPEMSLVNDLILRQTVVRHARECLATGRDLLLAIDEAIRAIEVGGAPVGHTVRRRCRICGVGSYDNFWNHDTRVLLFSTDERLKEAGKMVSPTFLKNNAIQVQTLRCNNCGHVELFHVPDGKTPEAWKI